MNEQQIVSEVLKTASSWGASFNNGDAKGCASFYAADATMIADPIAKAKGADDIQSFWQNLIDEGFAEVEYIKPEVKVVSDSEAELQSKWKMNKAHGIIHKEVWEKQDDGRWLLTHDHFEILG